MRFQRFAIVAFGVLLMFSSRLIADNLVMPGELAAEAQKLGCSQVASFFNDRHDMVRPPYVYGYAPGEESHSAAFWCQERKDNHQTYFLAFMFKGGADKVGNCPRKIEWMNPPGGLSLYSGRDWKLSDFIYMDQPKQHGPNIYPEHNAVKSSYGGTEAIFYCHRGRWLLLQLD